MTSPGLVNFFFTIFREDGAIEEGNLGGGMWVVFQIGLKRLNLNH